jgi:hypothetical protein
MIVARLSATPSRVLAARRRAVLDRDARQGSGHRWKPRRPNPWRARKPRHDDAFGRAITISNGAEARYVAADQCSHAERLSPTRDACRRRRCGSDACEISGPIVNAFSRRARVLRRLERAVRRSRRRWVPAHRRARSISARALRRGQCPTTRCRSLRSAAGPRPLSGRPRSAAQASGRAGDSSRMKSVSTKTRGVRSPRREKGRGRGVEPFSTGGVISIGSCHQRSPPSLGTRPTRLSTNQSGRRTTAREHPICSAKRSGVTARPVARYLCHAMVHQDDRLDQ